MTMSARAISGRKAKARLLRSTAGALCLATAACGGGGGGGVNSTPTPPVVSTPDPIVTPAPTPTPTPTPAPTPAPTTSYDTTEYRATVGAVSMNALAAYQRNATGAGIAVGIVDTGIDAGSEEFPGRISAASVNVTGSGTTDDVDGHGTAVAFTIAGRRNGAGTHGVAFDATVIVARADSPGSCAATGPDEGCSFFDPAIARGINLATANGARVINLSLGGSAPSAEVVAAIDRATAAGIIVVVSAGNDFDNDPATAINPDTFAQVANNDAASRGLVIIAGSVNASDQISAFSNRAGNSAAHYLTAVGERVRAPCDDTAVCLWSGTSFSAPQISGAVALLAQAFPNLTGAQIVSILFSSARDAGAAGADAVYGRGVLDLTRAFQPLGTSSVAGGQGALSFTSNAMLSAPMGDARQGTLGAVILDGYSRAFAMDLATTISRNAPIRGFTTSLQPTMRSFSSSIDGGTTVAVTLAATNRGIAVERTMLSPGDARAARAIAGMVTRRLGSTASFAFGVAQGSATLTAQLAGRYDPAFLVARDATTGQGFDSVIGGSGAYRQQFGAWGVAAGIESGDVLTGARTAGLPVIRYRYDRASYNRISIALDRAFGGVKLGLAASRLDESETLLGARFGAGLGATRGTNWFLDAVAQQDLGRGWSLRASMRQGWTLAAVRAGLSGSGLIRTNGFAADIAKDGLFGRRDGIGFRVSQPLRVAAGGIDLNLPVGYDYVSGQPNDWRTQRLNLAPTGREIDVEARYMLQLLGGDMQANLFWRRDAGNIAALPNDTGGALRYTLTF